MIRSVSAVVVGWLAMVVLVMAAFLVGPLVLGTDLMMDEGSYKASTLWNVCSAFIGITAALAGGAVCQKIARKKTPALVLASVVFVFSLPAILRGPDPEPPPRPADVTGREALEKAFEHRYEPLLTRILNLVLGTGGVLLGAALVRRRQSGPSDA